MAILNRITSPLTAENRTKLNENWDIIEQMLSSFRLQLQFVTGREDMEEIINRLAGTMEIVESLESQYTGSLEQLEAERDRLISESETSLQSQVDELTSQAQDQLTNEVATLQEQIATTIQTLQTNIETGETLQQESTELIDRLNTALDEMESRITAAIAQNDERVNATINEMESRVTNAIERTDTAIQAVEDERERVEQIQMIGEYDAGTSYSVGNMVTYAGSTFAARVEATGVAPVAHETSDEWQLIARRGLDGTGSVSTVNGVGPDDAGDVAITKATLGLGNVDNTSDLEKPLSNPQREYVTDIVNALDAVTSGELEARLGDLDAVTTGELEERLENINAEGVEDIGTNLKVIGAPGDGSDARQAMIDAISMDNETILVPTGTYTMKEIVIDRNTRIVGNGWGSILKLPTDLTTSTRGTVNGIEGISNAMFLINDAIHVTFENLTFDGDYFNQPERYNGGSFLRIFKPLLPGAGKVIVTFKNCQFINNNHSAILAYGSGVEDRVFINVYDCHFAGGAKGTSQTAIPDKWAQGYAPNYIGTYDNVTLTVNGNKFIDEVLPNNTSTFARIAIYASVTNTASVEDSDNYSTSMFITNNVFKNLGRHADSPNGLGVIDMYVNGENVVISGNKFIDSQMQSIRGKVNVKNLVVSDNVIQGGLDGAIAFHPNNYASKKGSVVISNNVVEDTLGYGILLNGDSTTDSNPYFERAIITGNMVNGIGAVTYRNDLANGIYLKKVVNTIVSNNQLTNILYDGIYMESLEIITISNNLIHTTTNVASLGRGIYGTGIVGVLHIENNVIRANVSAIYVTFDTSNKLNMFRNFKIIGNHAPQIRNVNSQGIYVSGFLLGIATYNIVDGMTPTAGATAYAFNFKGSYLTLIGNMYADVRGVNGDPTALTYGIKLRSNVGEIREIGNTWQPVAE